MSFEFGSGAGGRFPSSVVNIGDVDATLAANLPANPTDGDSHRISVGGTFEGSALVTPSQPLTVNDYIIWVDSISKWVIRDSGDDRLLTTNNLSDVTNSATARTNLDVYSKSEVDTEIDTDITTHNSDPLAHGIPSLQGYVWSKITGNTNAVVRNGYLTDSSGGVFNLTLPATPTVGDTIAVTDLGSAETNNITIARNGSNIDGEAEDLVINANKSYFKLTYADATIGWALSDVGQVAA